MNHAAQLIDLVDEEGTIIGQKKRSDVNKQADLYHTVFVILRTPEGAIVLSEIPDRTDLPNLYAGKVGPTVSTIRRHRESADEASKRAIKNELFLDDVQPSKIGESYIVLPDGHRKYMSVYLAVHALPKDFSHSDITSLRAFTKAELEKEIETHEAKFALTFLAVRKHYEGALLSA